MSEILEEQLPYTLCRLSELEPGEKIFITERDEYSFTHIGAEYIILEQNNGTTLLLRNAPIDPDFDNDENARYFSEDEYEDSAIDNYLSHIFVQRFDSYVQNSLKNWTITYQDMENNEMILKTLSRKVFSPSYTELFGQNSNILNEGTSYSEIIANNSNNMYWRNYNHLSNYWTRTRKTQSTFYQSYFTDISSEENTMPMSYACLRPIIAIDSSCLLYIYKPYTYETMYMLLGITDPSQYCSFTSLIEIGVDPPVTTTKIKLSDIFLDSLLQADVSYNIAVCIRTTAHGDDSSQTRDVVKEMFLDIEDGGVVTIPNYENSQIIAIDIALQKEVNFGQDPSFYIFESGLPPILYIKLDDDGQSEIIK